MVGSERNPRQPILSLRPLSAKVGTASAFPRGQLVANLYPILWLAHARAAEETVRNPARSP